MSLHLAIDLGAGSGRAILGRLENDSFRLEEVHRFTYGPRPFASRLRWNFSLLLEGLREGLRRARAAAGPSLASAGVDSWAVDYGLLDDRGRLLEDPVCYRDSRTDGVMEEVLARVPRREIFGRTGIQFLPFNTLYQLLAHVREGLPARAARLLLVPDLCHHALCGATVTERTNASTTQMLRTDGSWDEALLGRLALPRHLLPEVVAPGTVLGRINGTRVIAPATHDTASAVAGTPLQDGWAYVSSGTWSLVGVERPAAVLDEAAARANVTNEAGAEGTVRLLKNVMGLWILESCRREWEAAGARESHESLLRKVADRPGPVGFVNPDHPRFLHPSSMVRELQASLRETGQEVPEEPAALARVVLDSLALRYASVVDMLETLTGQPITGLHVVGGGSRNPYLNQATADAARRPVLAGPVEATAIGNVLVQAVACGSLSSLAEGRRLVARSVVAERYEPRPGAAWAEAAHRYRQIEDRVPV